MPRLDLMFNIVCWFQCLVGEQERHDETGIFEYHPEPYHYGSHYSNSGTVLHFLVRLPPFTQMFLSYQGKTQI